MAGAIQRKLRKSLQDAFHHRYKRLAISFKDCFYCGEPMDVWDHCPPLAMSECWDAAQLHKAPKHVLVPSCHDCNHLLGSKPLTTIPERLDFLESQLLRQFEKRFNLWQDDEIVEMSPMFQLKIKSEKLKTALLQNRIRTIQHRISRFDDYNF